MTLPIAVSVPHAGLRVPPEAAPFCQLTAEQIERDGDEGAAEIYSLQADVAAFLTTDVARAIVDLNRPEDDRGADGVIKTHTIWNEPIFRQPLAEQVIQQLLQQHYRPYHAALRDLADQKLLLAVDCHTMAAEAPPIGPDPGSRRPEVCLGDLQGKSLPAGWTDVFQRAFAEAFSEFSVTRNQPFAGGYITRSHHAEMPWLQVEISRAPFLPRGEIRHRVLRALTSAIGEIQSNVS